MSKIHQAPKPAILKRKRFPPSDWWLVAPLAPELQQQDQPPPKKRSRLSNFGAERAIQDSPAAANRGKTRKSVSLEDIENAGDGGGDGDGETAKPLGKGRSSNTVSELETVVAAETFTEIQGANQRKGKREEVTESVQGRRSNADAELQVDALESHQHEGFSGRKRGRRVLVEAENAKLVNEHFENAGKEKKKRGRPAVVQEKDELVTDSESAGVAKERRRRPRSVSAAEAQFPDEPHNGEAAGSPRFLRRGRSSNTLNELRIGAEMAATPHPGGEKRIEPPPASKDDAPANPLRRGRSSNTESQVRAIVEIPTTEQVSQKQRRKAANAGAQAPAQVLGSKKRTQRSDTEIVEVTVATSPTQYETQRKRRKEQHAELDGSASAESSAKGLDRRIGRGRRSDTTFEVETATSSFARNRNTSKKVDNPLGARRVKTKNGPSAAQKPSNSRGRQQLSNSDIRQDIKSQSNKKKSKGSAAHAKHKHAEDEERVEHSPEAKRRRRQRVSQKEAASQAEKIPTYQHLAPVTRKVSLQTIEAKWEPLPPACVERISQLVQDVQRPVVVHFNDDKKRTEANTALHVISRRLISKLSKGVPFPPPMRKFREDDFDFEKILDHNRALEAQLTPALHANELLEAELTKMTAHFESEQASLAALEINAKSEASVRKDAGRRLHSLLQSDSIINEDAIENHLGVVGDIHSVLPFSNNEDEDLQNVAQELNGHLETIQGNISKVEGISQAMAKSRAAVQAALFNRVENDEFEGLVLA